jgi:glycerol-3-phosphate dehydrogenase
MTRDVERLSRQRYDLLVVGGGIHGLFAAWDAAARGMTVALVDRADFGSGLSFNHQRTIHGGLRALETGHLGKARAQIEERRRWAVMAPHLVAPLPFVIGTYRGTKRSRLLIRAGFAAYNAAGSRRNRGLSAAWHLPASRVISTAEVARRFPGIPTAGLNGGAEWHDYQARHPDRLNWLVARAAIEAGADLFNYVEVVEPVRDGRRITGARVRVWPTSAEVDIRAAATLLCVGPQLGPLLTRFGAQGAPPLVRAANLLLRQPSLACAIAAPGTSRRTLTAVPWQGRTLVGTFQTDAPVGVDTPPPTGADIDAMLADANAAFPALAARREDVRLVHAGLTPAVVRNGRAELLPESSCRAHADDEAAGLYSVIGVKFTTARATAEAAVDRIAGDLGRVPCASITGDGPLPEADVVSEGVAEVDPGMAADVRAHLVDWYGAEAARVAAFCADRQLTGRLAPELPVLAGEIAYAVDHARAVRLADAVLRRTRLGETGHPDAAAIAAAADVMGPRLGWSDADRAAEIALVDARFASPSPARNVKL